MSGDEGIGPGPVRRALDVLVGLVGLIAGAPVLLVVALVVRLSSRGPAVFRQERVGQGGRPFTIYKFRTMRAGAAGPELTAPGDPRETAVGRLLRSSSLDELPQLLNLLLGDMTLVGPRPETPGLAARYQPDQREVFRYRPGLTGPGQLCHRDARALNAAAGGIEDIETHYFEVVVPARTALDMAYLASPTLAATLVWLARTARYVLGLRPQRRM